MLNSNSIKFVKGELKLDKAVIELTPKKLFGYILVAAGIILFLYVVINAVLLINGTIQPLKIEDVGLTSGSDVLAGIILQVGLFGVLTGIAYAIARIGLSIAKD